MIRAKRAVVVGGGYIGMEMTEQLTRRGLAVTVIEALPQVMSMLDPEMATLLHAELAAHGVDMRLGELVAAFLPPQEGEEAAIHCHGFGWPTLQSKLDTTLLALKRKGTLKPNLRRITIA